MKHTRSMVYNPSTESRELTLYAVNTCRLYESMIVPIVRNLAKKYSKGVFDNSKAIDAFYPVANQAAKMYCVEFARFEDAPHVFDVTARFTCAMDLLDYYMEDIEKGGF